MTRPMSEEREKRRFKCCGRLKEIGHAVTCVNFRRDADFNTIHDPETLAARDRRLP